MSAELSGKVFIFWRGFGAGAGAALGAGFLAAAATTRGVSVMDSSRSRGAEWSSEARARVSRSRVERVLLWTGRAEMGVMKVASTTTRSLEMVEICIVEDSGGDC